MTYKLSITGPSVIDDHLTLKSIWWRTGLCWKESYSSLLGRCRREVGEVGVGTFKKSIAEFLII